MASAVSQKTASLRARAATLRSFASEFVRDPLEGVGQLEARIAERSERHMPDGFMPCPPCPYPEDEKWEEQLHAILGLASPCRCGEEFDALWRSVMMELEARSLNLGRGAFGGWGDGEPGLVRAVWTAVCHLRPETVIETGVGRGLTTRFVLEAFERAGVGHLWSIDLPPPRSPDLHHQIGIAVPEGLRARWSYVRGSSRRRLPGLLSELGSIDLFVHDSRHSARNLLFELRNAWNALRP